MKTSEPIPAIAESTRNYERWLRKRLPLIRKDFERRHQAMAVDPLAFLRGSFFRWVETWPVLCPTLQDAPRVLGVGDLHIENFGTWRSAEGKLIWGINDFDEAAVLPYTNDLVRLATSALLASWKDSFGLSKKSVCNAILAGYRACVTRGGKPIQLTSKCTWALSASSLQKRQVDKFWRELAALPTMKSGIDPTARRVLESALPRNACRVRIVHRVSGLGSQGRQRFAVLAQVNGHPVAHEAKALTGSAWYWRQASERHAKLQYARLLRLAVRTRDPSVKLVGCWLLRQLGPDRRRIDLSRLPAQRLLRTLLKRMGWETANVHLGTPGQRKRILEHLKTHGDEWLREAARRMVEQTRKDWSAWRKAVRARL